MNDSKAPVMAIMIGIPASGKSTFCKYELPDYVRINLDTLHTRNKECIALDEAINQRRNVVIDNTNPTVANRQKYIVRAKETGYIVVGYFMESVFLDCLARNNMRTGKEKLPYGALASISKLLEVPSIDEGFDKLYYVSIGNQGFVIEDWR